MARSPEHVVLSQPCPVHWSGFESNTYALQQAGWELAIEQDFMQYRTRLLMRHQDLRLYALSEYTDFDYMRIAQSHDRGLLPRFRVQHSGTRMEVVRIMGDDLSMFRQVDARPTFATREVKSIEDFGIFATPLVRTEEIIVEPQEVSDILAQLLARQSDGQKEIRDRNRTRNREGEYGAGPAQKFHAQIISLDSVRAAA